MGKLTDILSEHKPSVVTDAERAEFIGLAQTGKLTPAEVKAGLADLATADIKVTKTTFRFRAPARPRPRRRLG